MKKLLHLFLFSGLIMIAFTACNRNQTAIPGSIADTTGLAAFQQWKMTQAYGDYPAVQKRSSSRPVSTASYSRNNSNSLTSEGQYPAKPSSKKGWSRKAKGALIGGGSGAIIGALIDKNHRFVGGALGGAVGAGLGYIVGNELDKKHGR